MRSVSVVLLCLACIGHGRRIQIPDDANALARLLLESRPPAAYHSPVPASPRRGEVSMSADTQKFAKDLGAKVLAGGLAGIFALTAVTKNADAAVFTRDDLASLTYDQIKGTGLANSCPIVKKGGDASGIAVGSVKKMDNFCLEPNSFSVLTEQITRKGTETVPVKAKVTTRQTYVLDGIDGKITTQDGKLTFIEDDGIDYAPTTIQLPGGERVPFLYTVKSLVAQAEDTADKITPGMRLSGKFFVPSYRTGLFLDPKGRGMTTGYDQAQALGAMQSGGDEGMFKENNKKFDVGSGSIDLKITEVNNELKEIGGVFTQTQPSDTDLGSKEPREVLLSGNWFATLE